MCSFVAEMLMSSLISPLQFGERQRSAFWDLRSKIKLAAALVTQNQMVVGSPHTHILMHQFRMQCDRHLHKQFRGKVDHSMKQECISAIIRMCLFIKYQNCIDVPVIAEDLLGIGFISEIL